MVKEVCSVPEVTSKCMKLLLVVCGRVAGLYIFFRHHGFPKAILNQCLVATIFCACCGIVAATTGLTADFGVVLLVGVTSVVFPLQIARGGMVASLT